MKQTITRKFSIDVGHRVWKHEGKCRNPHGHTYIIEASFTGELDSLGRVIDFSIIKDRLGNWLDQYWDHGFLYFVEDEVLSQFYQANLDMKSFSCNFNPTAENMSAYLLREVCPELFKGTGVTACSINIFETPNCSARSSLDGY